MGTKKSGGIQTNMKILYLGHFKENSGWSDAAINNVLALDSIGIDVVCRNVKLTGIDGKVPEKILELEAKKLKDIDYCIQHVLPHHLCASSKFKKNIAYFVHESSSIKYNQWFVNLQQMDEVWVPTSYAKNNLENDQLNLYTTLRVVPHCFDIFNYQEEYEKLNVNDINNKFKFYTIADVNDRKNIKSILRCYFSEFTKADNVTLILKLKKYGFDKKQLSDYISDMAKDIQTKLRLYNSTDLYPEYGIIGDHLSPKQIKSLHQSCDCFIGPSRGEGWSIPAFEAMCFGKTPICSNEGGPSEFIDKDNKSTGTLINGTQIICDHSDPAFPNIFTGHETWFQPSEVEIKQAMRYYYEHPEVADKIQGIKQGRKFSFDNVANTMKEYLND